VEHIPGEELQTLATDVINQPPDIVKRITELLETK
jgi:hypothetical protein